MSAISILPFPALYSVVIQARRVGTQEGSLGSVTCLGPGATFQALAERGEAIQGKEEDTGTMTGSPQSHRSSSLARGFAPREELMEMGKG